LKNEEKPLSRLNSTNKPEVNQIEVDHTNIIENIEMIGREPNQPQIPLVSENILRQGLGVSLEEENENNYNMPSDPNPNLSDPPNENPE
jgi:hypothetical protein